MSIDYTEDRYAVLDVETANPYEKGSICAIGIVLLDDLRIIDSFYSLINPESPFSPQNVAVHGIAEEDVLTAPNFRQAWPDIAAFMGGRTVVSYNATFDIYALEKALYDAGYSSVDYPYVCAMDIARKVTGMRRYGLNAVAEALGLSFQHHNALEDAAAAAEVLIRLCRIQGASSLYQLMQMADVPVQHMSLNGYEPHQDNAVQNAGKRARSTYAYRRREPDTTLSYTHTECFAGRTVVFTGNLASTSRSEARRIVTELGGICKTSVSKRTDYVIMGSYEPETLLPGSSMGKKAQQALELQQQGFPIRVLDEAAFLSLLQAVVEEDA